MDPALAIEVAASSNQKALDDITALGNSPVQKFYNNSVVFLTGGSGFLGKQLIEKLFRSCKISKVFMLLRPKKGKLVQERLQQCLKDPVFDTLRKTQPDFVNKIVAVEGDVAEIKLGIKNEDWNTLTEEVDVMFHVAATTKFDETLRVATLNNVRGTREAILLGKSCKKLRSYVHVSTAYTHATTRFIGKEVREQFYKAPVPPEAMISMAESMDADRLISITKEIVKDWPNTYTFTKSISEELVRTMSTGLPICIVRPAIVIGSYREPSPGWLDISCVYGATGLVLGTMLGVLHVVRVKSEVKLGLVPCDYVNNAIIVAGRETAANQAKGGTHTKIYTVSSTQRNPAIWRQLQETARTKGVKIPPPSTVYYQYAYCVASYGLFMILTLFLHLIPAYIADFVSLLMGKQRRFVKTAKKVYNMCNALSYFLMNEWQLVDDNLDKLYNNLSYHDKIIFNFDITDIDWTEYFLIWCIGMRKYIIKDGLKGTEYGIKKQKYLRVAHYFITMLYYYGIWKLICLLFYIVSGIFSS